MAIATPTSANGTRGTVRRGATPQGWPARRPSTTAASSSCPPAFSNESFAPQSAAGLAHSYCLTSYAAQGETYEAARHLGTDPLDPIRRLRRANFAADPTAGSTRSVTATSSPEGDDGPPAPARTPHLRSTRSPTGFASRADPNSSPHEHDPYAYRAVDLASGVPFAELTNAVDADEITAHAVAARREPASPGAASNDPDPRAAQSGRAPATGRPARRMGSRRRAHRGCIARAGNTAPSPIQPEPGAGTGPVSDRASRSGQRTSSALSARPPRAKLAERLRSATDPAERGAARRSPRPSRSASPSPSRRSYLLAVLGDPARWRP